MLQSLKAVCLALCQLHLFFANHTIIWLLAAIKGDFDGLREEEVAWTQKYRCSVFWCSLMIK